MTFAVTNIKSQKQNFGWEKREISQTKSYTDTNRYLVLCTCIHIHKRISHTDIYKNSTYEQPFKDRHEDKIAEHRIKIHNDTL